MVFHPKDSINRSSLTGSAIAIALIKMTQDLCKMVFRRKSIAFSAGTLQNTPDARN